MDRLYSSLVQFRRILVVAALLVLLRVPVAVALEIETEIPLLTEALLRGDYALLEQKFTTWQQAYEAGSGSEWTVDDNFETFLSSDPDFEARLDEWNRAYPDSFAAPMARALYLSHRTKLARDNLWANSIPSSVTEKNEEWRKESARDFLTAIKRHPRLTVAYAGLMDLEVRFASSVAIDRIFDQGVAVNPDSAAIYASHIASLNPFWNFRGTTYSDQYGLFMTRYHELQLKFRDNPDFDWMDGYDHYVAAWTVRGNDCNPKSLSEFDKAIEARGNWYYYLDRAETLVCVANRLFTPERKREFGVQVLQRQFKDMYRRARLDFEQATRLNPNNAHAQHKAAIYRQELCVIRRNMPGHVLDQCVAALGHLRLALSRDPLNPKITMAFANLVRKLSPTADVRGHVDNALVFGKWNHRVLRDVAVFLMESDPAVADGHFRTAIRLAPTEERAESVLRDYLLFRVEQRSCDAFPVLEEVERICRGGAACARRFDHILDAFQMRAGHVCGAVLGPVASKPLPMPDDVVPQ